MDKFQELHPERVVLYGFLIKAETDIVRVEISMSVPETVKIGYPLECLEGELPGVRLLREVFHH